MKEPAVVISFTAPIAKLKLEPSSSCIKCGMCANRPGAALEIDAESSIALQPGDRVEVNIPENSVILSSMLIFIAPLIVFFGGYIIDGPIFAAILTAIYLLFLCWFDRGFKCRAKVLRVL
jgi:positive regulator of sigma E activity